MTIGIVDVQEKKELKSGKYKKRSSYIVKVTRIGVEYPLLLRWDSIPTTLTSIAEYKKLQNLRKRHG